MSVLSAPRWARHGLLLMSLCVLAALAVMLATREAAADRRTVENVKIILEARKDVRAGIATWKQYGHAAADNRQARLAYSEELVARGYRAYQQGRLLPEAYSRLLQMRHRLNDLAEREYRERRALNQRMKINARQSIVLSRLPVIREYRKKWVYTRDKAEQAIMDSASIRSIVSEIDALSREIEAQVAEAPDTDAACSEAEKQGLAEMINGYNKRWADRWCSPHAWSGCGAPALGEANGLRYHLGGATTRAQCNWIRRIASCKDECMMNYIGDAGAAQLAQCLTDCALSLPVPGN